MLLKLLHFYLLGEEKYEENTLLTYYTAIYDVKLIFICLITQLPDSLTESTTFAEMSAR